MPRGPLDHMIVEWEAGSPADVEQVIAAVMEAINAGNCLFARKVPDPRPGYQATFIGCAVEPPENIQEFYDDWVKAGCPLFNRPTTRPIPRPVPDLKVIPGFGRVG